METVMETSTPATPVDQYVDVKGVTTRYWTGGDAGSPVVLIHGLGGYVEAWLPSLGALATEHRVYALDLIGCGRTAKPSGASYDLATLSQFVRDFMTATEIECAHVVGHSLGGAIATRLALGNPGAVDRLVLVASAGMGREVHVMLRLMRVPIVGGLLTRPSRSGSAKVLKLMVDDESLMDDKIEHDYQMTSLPGAQKALLKILRECWKSLASQVKGTDGPDLRGLATSANAVLVIWGRQDRVLPVANAEVAAQKVPNATVKLIDHCGHLPMFEHPQEFNALLLDFLRD